MPVDVRALTTLALPPPPPVPCFRPLAPADASLTSRASPPLATLIGAQPAAAPRSPGGVPPPPSVSPSSVSRVSSTSSCPNCAAAIRQLSPAWSASAADAGGEADSRSLTTSVCPWMQASKSADDPSCLRALMSAWARSSCSTHRREPRSAASSSGVHPSDCRASKCIPGRGSSAPRIAGRPSCAANSAAEHPASEVAVTSARAEMR
eukprot:scaffold30783_cov67-Isochrysis_galbana.AAC.1